MRPSDSVDNTIDFSLFDIFINVPYNSCMFGIDLDLLLRYFDFSVVYGVVLRIE